MKDVHDLLGEALRDERWALPVPAGALDSIESGARRVRRRRRRSMALAGVAAVALVVGVAAAVQDPRLEGGPRPATSIIPMPDGPGMHNALALSETSLYVMTRTRVHRIDRASQQVVATSPRLPIERPERLELAGNTLWAEAWVAGPSDVRYYALDAMTLAWRKSLSLPVTERHVAGSDGIFSLQHDSTRQWLVRRDPNTGNIQRRSTVTATCNPPDTSYLVSVDQPARVAWLACHSAEDSVTLLSLDSETGAERGRVPLGEGVPYSAPGTGGTLWVMLVPMPDGTMWIPENRTRFFHLSPLGGLSLPADEFRAARRLKPTFGLGLTAGGPRMLHQTQGEHEIGCFDRHTGGLLETYRVPMRRGEDTSALAGDDSEIFTTSGNQILVRRGPDKCLS